MKKVNDNIVGWCENPEDPLQHHCRYLEVSSHKLRELTKKWTFFLQSVNGYLQENFVFMNTLHHKTSPTRKPLDNS